MSCVVGGTAGCTHGSAHDDVVVVPNVRATDVVTAFDRLRARGLRVTVPRLPYLSDQELPMATREVPAAGARVPRGTSVRLGRIIPGPLGSRGFGVTRRRTLPNFVGETVMAAVDALSGTNVSWRIANLPAVHDSTAPHLLSEYIVTQQQPRPGAIIPAVTHADLATGHIPEIPELTLVVGMAVGG